MKKIYSLLLIILIITSINCRNAYASSKLPADIPDVFCYNLRITADNSNADQIGMVHAFHMTTNELIWSKSIYSTIKDTNSEEPLMPIKSMNYSYGKLVIVNEANKVFELDPSTGDIYHYDTKGIALGSICVVAILTFTLTLHYLWSKIKNRENR